MAWYVMCLMLCYALICHDVAMLCSVMLCHARVMFCHIMLCHGVFSRVCRGREAGYPGSSGQLGVWRPRYAGWGWPGSLFLKSNNPNLSGGESEKPPPWP